MYTIIAHPSYVERRTPLFTRKILIFRFLTIWASHLIFFLHENSKNKTIKPIFCTSIVTNANPLRKVGLAIEISRITRSGRHQIRANLFGLFWRKSLFEIFKVFYRDLHHFPPFPQILWDYDGEVILILSIYGWTHWRVSRTWLLCMKLDFLISE